jgi:hypothetical protein
MDKHLVIKIFKKSVKSRDNKSRVIVVTYNSSKVNGGFRFDKIGVIKYYKNIYVCYINFYKLGYWLNRGAYLKTKVSWLTGIVSKYEAKLK